MSDKDERTGTGSGPDIQDLERLPDPPKEDPKAKPKKPAGGRKMSDEDKSRAFGMAATVVCVAGLAIFLIMQFLPTGENLPSAETSVTAAPTEAPLSNDLPDTGSVQKPATDTPDYDPYNRFPPAITDEDGQEVSDGNTPAQGGTRYWIRDRDKANMFKIVIPAGYQAFDYGDSIAVAKSDADMSVTDDDPLMFYWLNGIETRALLENGYYDYLAGTGTTGFAQYDVKAVGYYLFKDEDGDEWPVVTGLFTRQYEEDESGVLDYNEYRIAVGKPTKYGQYLSGAIPVTSFATVRSQAYPDITALAKAMFPASSEPDFPEQWAWYWDDGTDESRRGHSDAGWWDEDGNYHPPEPEESYENGYWDEYGNWVPSNDAYPDAYESTGE